MQLKLPTAEDLGPLFEAAPFASISSKLSVLDNLNAEGNAFEGLKPTLISTSMLCSYATEWQTSLRVMF